MKRNRFHGSVVLILLGTVAAFAQDWPQFMGPNRDGTSSRKGIIKTWPATGPEVLWSLDIGIGYGGPVARDGKVYLLDRNDQTGDIMRCIDLASGKELWHFAYDAPGEIMFPGSRSVPVVEDNYVYSSGPYGDLYCFDINTHQPVWHKNIWKDFGGEEIPRWAVSQCPFIYGDLLILASQAPQAGVVAYDKKTGDVKWVTPSLGAVGYVSPTPIKIAGEVHVVMITASAGGGFDRTGGGGRVIGLNPVTGRLLWEYTNWQCRIPAPLATAAGDNKILIVGGYEAGAAMLQIVKTSDGSYIVKELFKNPDFGDHTKPAILVNGHFYAQYSTNERKDGLVCMDMNGKVLWKTGREPLFDKGSIIVADGLILATDGMTKLYLIQPDPSGFKPIASAELLKSGGAGINQSNSRAGGAAQNWAPIALTDGKLLIRDQRKLLCVKVAE